MLLSCVSTERSWGRRIPSACVTQFRRKVFSSPQSEAQELTTVKMSKFGGGIGAPTTEERLKEAADIHLRLGQIQRYCELMVELGEVRGRRSEMHEFSSTVGLG